MTSGEKFQLSMNPAEDSVCSEVHTFSAVEADASCSVARFRFAVPRWISDKLLTDSKAVEYDSDGDVVVRRREELNEEVLFIEHDLTTPISGVGRQIWKGSLLLADYLLHNPQFGDNKILEVGSGTGLTSIIAAYCGARVTASDINNHGILEKIKSNISRNPNLVKTPVAVRALDVKVERYRELNEAFDVIIAGDLIYDDGITDAFVDFIADAFETNGDLTVIVSAEKRYVFTVKDLDSVAPAVDHFMIKLTALVDALGLTVTSVPTDFKQYFCYERGKDMVLLQINRS